MKTHDLEYLDMIKYILYQLHTTGYTFLSFQLIGVDATGNMGREVEGINNSLVTLLGLVSASTNAKLRLMKE